MNADDAADLRDAFVAVGVTVARHAIDSVRVPLKLPALVVSVVGTIATVQVVGATTSVDVQTLVTVTGGQRVMVEDYGDGAAYVSAVIPS